MFNKILIKSPTDSVIISIYLSYFFVLYEISRFAKIELTEFTLDLQLCTYAQHFLKFPFFFGFLGLKLFDTISN